MAQIAQNLPEVLDTRVGSDTDRLLQALCAVLGEAGDDLQDVLDDRFVATADGAGLDRLGIGYAIPKPPHLTDAQYASLIQTKLPARRGTLQAIRSVFEAAYGSTLVSIHDRQTGLQAVPIVSVPGWTICIELKDDALGRAAWAGLATNTDSFPVESAIAGPAYAVDSDPRHQGLYNDYYWAPIDVFTKEVVDCVRLAGTVIIYKADESEYMALFPCYPEYVIGATGTLSRAEIVGQTVVGQTSIGAVVLTLPLTGEMGEGDDGCDFFFVRDGANNLTVAANTGQTILGWSPTPLVLATDRDSISLRFFWNGGSPIWQVMGA